MHNLCRTTFVSFLNESAGINAKCAISVKKEHFEVCYRKVLHKLRFFFDKIGGCVLQDCIFIKTQVHQIFFSQNILSKTVSFWHIFQKESAVSSPVKWQSEHCWLVTLLNVTQLSPSIIFHNLFICVEREISSFVLNKETT